TLFALSGVLVLAWFAPSREEDRPLALGALVLIPPVVLGAVFGAPAALSLALLVAGAWASARGRPVAAGVLVGVATAVDAAAWVAAPFLLLPLRDRDRALWRRGLVAAAVAFGLLCLPSVLLDAGAFLAALSRAPDLSPGLGLMNAVLYRGAEDEPATRALLACVPLVAVAAVLGLLRLHRRIHPAAAAALAVLLLLFLQPGTTPEAIALPIGLLALHPLALRT
ncbi:MAG TPA: glycosyltransferase 87 family protein, partial [Vicinamibacteria bacterium]|nr:glycosyltransferase 87 family protein [Vicinamibacteria bacterium]